MASSVLPTTARPARFTYRLKQLKHLPERLFCPCDAGVGTVRSFRVTPKFDVKLDDVLNARHLPPLGLKEFEEYLLFVEHSAENMYFWFWLKRYAETYAKLVSDGVGRDALSAELRESYACARATFFVPGVQFELNLPAEVSDTLPPPPRASDAPVPPAAFDAVRQQVLDMLQHSLQSFISSHCRNAGRNRGIFAIVVGLVVCAVGLAPILLSFYRSGRFLAFAALPCLWLGVGTLVAGLHGVCIVIFLFGDARQLHPFELVSPSEADLLRDRGASGGTEPGSRRASVSKDASVGMRRISTSSTAKDAGADVDVADAREKRTHQIALCDDARPSLIAVAPFLAGPEPEASSAGSPYSAGAPGQSSSFSWTIASLSSGTLERRSHARENVRSVFAPMAEVLSPIVRRSQWEIIVRSFSIGLLVALIACGLCAAPYRGR